MNIQDIKFVSGIGQFHTNEPDAANPKKRLKPYLAIGVLDILALVDKPQSVDKQQSQWLIPSTIQSREFKKQESEGEYWALWADLDKSPPPMPALTEIIDKIFGGADFELYNSRSATADNQKARLLVWLLKPLNGIDWVIAQTILNNKLSKQGIEPDRANERHAQLCYLPNKGQFYGSSSSRNGKYFNPLNEWHNEISHHQKATKAAKEKLEADLNAAKARRESLKLSDAQSIYEAFNQAYTVQDWLTSAGYDQRGNCFRHPGSETGNYSASVKDGKVHSLSSNDPLYSPGMAHDAFSVFCTLMHDGKKDAALIDAGDNLLSIGGVSWNKARQIEYKKQEEQKKQQSPPDDIEIDIDWSGHKQDGSGNESPPKTEPTFKLISAGDLLTKSIKHDWLVHKLFECNNLGQFFGETGSGKSFVILDLAYCIASGLEFCGLPVKQGNVVYICGEGYSGLTRRIKALQIKYNSDVSKKLFISEQPAAFMNSVVTADVAMAIKSVGDVKLVIVDTLHRNMGGGSEDSADDFGIILKNIDTYLKPLGVTTLIVHHCGHANQDRARGSYSIRASMDFEYQVVINGSKITVKNTKMKDGETPKPLAFDLKQIDIGSDDDGEVITSAYLEYRGEVSQAKEKSKIKLQGKEELILNKLIALTRDQGVKPTQAIINEFSGYFSGALNSNKKVLPFEIWRNAARLLISESDPKNERTNFSRMKKKFYDAGLLREFDGYIWPILDDKNDDNVDIDSFINNL